MSTDSDSDSDSDVVEELREALERPDIDPEAERHGGVLIEDFARSFNFTFSSGTVYPVLHDLADAGLLDAQGRAASKKKDYAFQDPEAAYTRIEQRAEQHAALARFLHAALEPRRDD